MISYIRHGDASEKSLVVVREYVSKLPCFIRELFSDKNVSIYITDQVLKNDDAINGLACPEKDYVVLRERNKDGSPYINPVTVYHECGHLIDYYANRKEERYLSEEWGDFISAWNREKKAFFEVFKFKDTSANDIDIVEVFAYLFSYYTLGNHRINTRIQKFCPLLWTYIDSFYKSNIKQREESIHDEFRGENCKGSL